MKVCRQIAIASDCARSSEPIPGIGALRIDEGHDRQSASARRAPSAAFALR